MKSTLAIIVMLQCVILGVLAESKSTEVICAIAGGVWLIIAIIHLVFEYKNKS